MISRIHRRFIPWILHHAFEFKWYYLGAFVCLYVLQIFQAEIPERIRSFTEQMTVGGSVDFSVWIFLGLAIGILFFRTSSRLLFFYPARVQQKLLRMELLTLLEEVPSTRYKDKSQGQIFQIIFDDINNLRAFIGFGMLQVFNVFIAAWVLIPKVNKTDSYLWPAFTPLFLSVFIYTVVTLINQKLFKQVADKKGEVQQYIIESYEAKQTIKNFHREDQFIRGFFNLSAEEMRLFFKSSIGFAFSGPYVRLAMGISLIWAAILIRKNGGGTPDLVFFSGFLYLFLEPIQFLSWVAVVVSQGFAAWKRVKELHSVLIVPSPEEKEMESVDTVVTENHIQSQLNFWDTQIKLLASRGKWTVFIGETGSGKSYILSKLATGLVLKGHKVSMVQQEPYLFNDTVMENIFLGREPSPENYALATELLKIFQLDNLASSIDEVMKLEVGENGKRLSGGQMKRVALVRSLMSGADILIWDDPFSSVDIILEKRIISKLRTTEAWRNHTFIISSHRLTTVRLSDDVIYLDRSSGIKAQGNAEHVLKEENVARFFKEQMVDVPLA
jgi:ATP-binding cassette subfamily B multidrug efflux pump